MTLLYLALLIQSYTMATDALTRPESDKTAFCEVLEDLHELDLDQAIKDTRELVSRDGDSLVDGCF